MYTHGMELESVFEGIKLQRRKENIVYVNGDRVIIAVSI